MKLRSLFTKYGGLLSFPYVSHENFRTSVVGVCFFSLDIVKGKWGKRERPSIMDHEGLKTRKNGQRRLWKTRGGG